MGGWASSLLALITKLTLRSGHLNLESGLLFELLHQHAKFFMHGVDAFSVALVGKVHMADKISRYSLMFNLHHPLVYVRDDREDKMRRNNSGKTLATIPCFNTLYYNAP